MLENADGVAFSDDGKRRWQEALKVVQLVRIFGPDVGGIRLKCRAGSVRNRWMDLVLAEDSKSRPWQKVNPQTGLDRLKGALDATATLRASKLRYERGILEKAHGGALVIAMAERIEPTMAAAISSCMDAGGFHSTDAGTFCPAEFLVIAIDESAEENEAVPPMLADRLPIHLDLEGIAWRETDPDTDAAAINRGGEDWRYIDVSEQVQRTFVAAALLSGSPSLRTVKHLSDIARMLAVIAGERTVDRNSADLAVRLCIGEVSVPELPDDLQQDHEQPPPNELPENEHTNTDGENSDIPDEFEVLAQAAARIDLIQIERSLAATRTRRRMNTGKAGTKTNQSKRGRPIGHTSMPPFSGARPDVLATIRAAVPWQKIRSIGSENPDDALRSQKLKIRKSDFRYKRYKHKSATTAIFVVDASGSTAVERLGETKGAIELLLADCYVRRDQVALLAFRGDHAEILLQPTRSLVRTKRSLSGLPGGGTTPLASGLQLAQTLADAERRKGNQPLLVFLTDGSGNIALDGTTGRAVAAEEAAQLAARIGGERFPAVLIDISRFGKPAAEKLATALRAEYLPLPRTDAGELSRLVSQRMEQRA